MEIATNSIIIVYTIHYTSVYWTEMVLSVCLNRPGFYGILLSMNCSKHNYAHKHIILSYGNTCVALSSNHKPVQLRDLRGHN